MARNTSPNSQPNPFIDWRSIVFLLLAVAAITAPHVVNVVYGLHWAAATGAVVVILWSSTMPVTCMEGGLIFSMVAMTILVNAAVLIFASLAGLIGPFFT